jgi:hypothetical protein
VLSASNVIVLIQLMEQGMDATVRRHYAVNLSQKSDDKCEIDLKMF